MVLMKRIIVVMFLCCLVSPHVAQAAYKDVPHTHWGKDTVDWVIEEGYMTSYDGYFSPNKPIARIDAVVALAQMAGIHEQPITRKLAFTDLQPTDKGYSIIEQLVTREVLVEQQTFQPYEPITRAQLSKLLAMLFTIQTDYNNTSHFADIPNTLWAKTYIDSLADIGIIDSTQPAFYPHRPVTKVQLAAFMHRIQSFEQKMLEYDVIYDYLQKKYIFTFNYSDSWVKSVIDSVNIERSKENLLPLVLDKQLSQIAIIKAMDMKDNHYFEHKSPTYGYAWDMASLFNYRFQRFGENIAIRFQSPEDVVYAWMNSEKHRANILKAHFTHMGIGIQYDEVEKQLYWVQFFATK